MTLDTNVVLYLLRGELEEPLPARDVSISVITMIELPVYPGLGAAEERSVRDMLGCLHIVPVDEAVGERAVELARMTGLRLPDAVILATAVQKGGILLTNDRGILSAAPESCRAVRLTNS